MHKDVCFLSFNQVLNFQVVLKMTPTAGLTATASVKLDEHHYWLKQRMEYQMYRKK